MIKIKRRYICTGNGINDKNFFQETKKKSGDHLNMK